MGDEVAVRRALARVAAWLEERPGQQFTIVTRAGTNLAADGFLVGPVAPLGCGLADAVERSRAATVAVTRSGRVLDVVVSEVAAVLSDRPQRVPRLDWSDPIHARLPASNQLRRLGDGVVGPSQGSAAASQVTATGVGLAFLGLAPGVGEYDDAAVRERLASAARASVAPVMVLEATIERTVRADGPTTLREILRRLDGCREHLPSGPAKGREIDVDDLMGEAGRDLRDLRDAGGLAEATGVAWEHVVRVYEAMSRA